ncbi:tetrahydrofolate dehydrogenase/cyclohydrolase catalytic domain-containing protein [uncultured Limosilactobacillus sp.]|uniref:bifunctional 5,10-methylenetetrahydrofolate dehydrogenase/5,10-methenyltetrahydrofolate cyclohydrolase n=1 Tax=uncultured Limosilactobacillus sp. TaxID=2837629 RepID=UPI0025E90346|nr:tetrahydrofolate dehydrogenase/cyclohydrolase catalytic domain-containing protein [uncultured Limosilactobacillus sp.]
MATIIDGRAYAKEINRETKQRVDRLKKRGIIPKMAVVLVGDDPASKIYTRTKQKKAKALGISCQLLRYPAAVSQAELTAEIERLNADQTVNAIMVQEPLPAHIDNMALVGRIAPEKDVDGFHPVNVGKLYNNFPGNYPISCTPRGIMMALDHYQVPIAGADVVIVGRSILVGRPLQSLFINRDATVTMCGRKTPHLLNRLRQADIVVVAAGKPNWITGDDLKQGSVVIDVGINRLADGKLVGDVDFVSASQVAGTITPVPGGVGPLTVAVMEAQTVDLTEWQHE